MTFNGTQFTAAARRRAGKPLTFKLDTWIYPDDEDEIARMVEAGEEVGHPETVTFMVNPKVDLVTLGAAFGACMDSVGKLGQKDLTSAERMELIASEMPKVRTALRQILTPPSRQKWDDHGEEFEPNALAKLIEGLIGELSGMDPTQRGSSSDPSQPDTATSTDGAVPAVSTPPASSSGDA